MKKITRSFILSILLTTTFQSHSSEIIKSFLNRINCDSATLITITCGSVSCVTLNQLKDSSPLGFSILFSALATIASYALFNKEKYLSRKTKISRLFLAAGITLLNTYATPALTFLSLHPESILCITSQNKRYTAAALIALFSASMLGASTWILKPFWLKEEEKITI